MEDSPKKKGRKKKLTVEKELQALCETESVKTKRGRKAKVVEFKKNVKLVDFDLEEPCLLKLPIDLSTLLETIPTQLGIEKILMSAPSSPIPINSQQQELDNDKNYEMDENENLTKNEDMSKISSKEIEKPCIFNLTDKYGNPDKVTVYNSTPLPFQSDHENIKRVEVTKTDIACWWCCHQFDTFPVCCPLKYDSKKDIFRVVGVFCSFNCAKSFSSGESGFDTNGTNSYLYKRLTNELKTIKKAPPRTVLKMFGGPISIEEYRETFDSLSSIKINRFPMTFIPTQVEYHKVNNLVSKSMQKIKNAKSRSSELSKNSLVKASERQSISSKKNIKTTDNTLMDIMGIKIKEN